VYLVQSDRTLALEWLETRLLFASNGRWTRQWSD